MGTKHADVVIVGMGASGVIVAKELAEAGYKVIGIEKGPYYRQEDFWHKFDELRYSVRYGLSPHMGTDPMTWRPNEETPATILPWATGFGLTVGNPLFLPPAIGVGGGVNHYACWHWRLLREDFKMRTTIIERLGKDRLPEGARIVDWPITYEDLEPFYDKVEYTIGVSGQAGNLNGKIQPGGNPFEGPRKRPYPLPPLRPGAANRHFAEVVTQLGYHPFPAPAAILSEDWEGRKGCTYCGFCRDYLCHVGAKSSVIDAIMPKAMATGNLEVVELTRIQRVHVDAEGHARFVSGVNSLTQEPVEISGDLIILAAYSLENVRLLLASGLNKNGLVGKYYMTHNYAWLSGILPEATHPYAGPAVTGYVVDDTNALFADLSHETIAWGTPIIFFDGDFQPIEGAKNLPPDVPFWGKPFKDWLKYGYRRLFGIYSQVGSLPLESNCLDLDPHVKDPWGQPVLRMTHDWTQHDADTVRWVNKRKAEIAREMGALKTWEMPERPPYHISTHEHGGHVMNDDPTQGVVNRYCQSFEVPNMFVLGGGVFPTLGGYNPTGTIQALTFWTAEYIKREAQRGGLLTASKLRADH